MLDNESEIDKILEGEEISHIGGTTECMEWLQECKRKGGIGDVKLDTTYREFQHFVSEVKEKRRGTKWATLWTLQSPVKGVRNSNTSIQNNEDSTATWGSNGQVEGGASAYIQEGCERIQDKHIQ